MNQLKTAYKIITNTKEFLPAIRYKNITTIPENNLNNELVPKAPIPFVNSQILKTLFSDEKIAAKTFLTFRENGKKVPAYITKFEKTDKIHLFIKNEQADKLGYASIGFPQNGAFKKPIGRDYIYNSMELLSLESKNNANRESPYRGIGTELLKAAVKESKAKGFGGRLHLMAYDAKPPTIFYYKNGFKFTSKEKDILMQKYLSTPSEQRGNLPEDLQCGLMYLPEENIEKLLAL